MTRARVAVVAAILIGIASAAVTAYHAGVLAPRANESTRVPPRARPMDPLARRYGSLRERLESRGYDEVETLSRVFLLEARGQALPLALAPGACSTLVALGAGGLRAMRVFLYGPDGDLVASSDLDVEAGLAHVCPRGSSRAMHYAVLEPKSGRGPVDLGLFRSVVGGGEGFEGVFEGLVAPRVSLHDVEEAIGRERNELERRGLTLAGEPRVEHAVEGETIRLVSPLVDGRCYVALAIGGDGVRDIDLFVFDPGGAEVARDLSDGARSRVEHCANASGDHMLEGRVFEGGGAVGLALFDATATMAIRAESAPDGVAPPEAPASDPAAALRATAGALLERGYRRMHMAVDGAVIAPGEVAVHDVLLGPGCGTVLGAVSASGADLDLYLASSDGGLIDRDVRVDPTARVSACAERATVHRVQVKSYGQRARYALATLAAPERVRSVGELRLLEAGHLLGLPEDPPGEIERRTLGEGDRIEAEVTLAAGRCVSVIAAGDEHVADLDLFLRAAGEGTLLASDTGLSASAAVSRCASEHAEHVRVEVFVYHGEGEVLWRILERP